MFLVKNLSFAHVKIKNFASITFCSGTGQSVAELRDSDKTIISHTGQMDTPVAITLLCPVTLTQIAWQNPSFKDPSQITVRECVYTRLSIVHNQDCLLHLAL